jgi:hypothetical protein
MKYCIVHGCCFGGHAGRNRRSGNSIPFSSSPATPAPACGSAISGPDLSALARTHVPGLGRLRQSEGLQGVWRQERGPKAGARGDAGVFIRRAGGAALDHRQVIVVDFCPPNAQPSGQSNFHQSRSQACLPFRIFRVFAITDSGFPVMLHAQHCLLLTAARQSTGIWS